MKSCGHMKHIAESGFDFDQRLAHRYMRQIKDAVSFGIWKIFCDEWFDYNYNGDLKDKDLLKLVEKPSNELECHFIATFSDIGDITMVLNEKAFYASFYNDPQIYKIAKPEGCALIDIALSKGGPEAIAESFYNSMRSQQIVGGQSNENLVRRTKVNWCLPPIAKCKNIVDEAVKIYHEGDEKIKPHSYNIFQSARATSYDVSKVIDRVNATKGRCPFLTE